jgi:hypothetical protein
MNTEVSKCLANQALPAMHVGTNLLSDCIRSIMVYSVALLGCVTNVSTSSWIRKQSYIFELFQIDRPGHYTSVKLRHFLSQ